MNSAVFVEIFNNSCYFKDKNMNLSIWMLFCGCFIILAAGGSIEDAIKEHHVVPDVIDGAPQKTIEVNIIIHTSRIYYR